MSGCARAYAADRAEFVIIINITIITFMIITIIIIIIIMTIIILLLLLLFGGWSTCQKCPLANNGGNGPHPKRARQS